MNHDAILLGNCSNCVDSRQVCGAFAGYETRFHCLKLFSIRHVDPAARWRWAERPIALPPEQKVGALMPGALLSKSSCFFKVARRSLVACSPICGACVGAVAEERQAAPNSTELSPSVVKTSFADPSSVGLVEISPLHPTRGPQMGDWMACLRIVIDGQPTFYAAFIDSPPP